MIAFPAVLIVTFFIEGIKIIRHEGMKPSNLLSMLFSILLSVYLVVWPVIGNLEKGKFSTMLYVIVSFSAIYVLPSMTIHILQKS